MGDSHNMWTRHAFQAVVQLVLCSQYVASEEQDGNGLCWYNSTLADVCKELPCQGLGTQPQVTELGQPH